MRHSKLAWNQSINQNSIFIILKRKMEQKIVRVKVRGENSIPVKKEDWMARRMMEKSAATQRRRTRAGFLLIGDCFTGLVIWFPPKIWAFLLLLNLTPFCPIFIHFCFTLVNQALKLLLLFIIFQLFLYLCSSWFHAYHYRSNLSSMFCSLN